MPDDVTHHIGDDCIGGHYGDPTLRNVDDVTLHITGQTIPPDHTLVITVPTDLPLDRIMDMRDAIAGHHPGPVIFLGGGNTAESVPPDQPITLEQQRAALCTYGGSIHGVVVGDTCRECGATVDA